MTQIKDNMDEFKQKFVAILFKSTSKDELSVERLYELVDKIAPEVIDVAKEEIMKKSVVGEVMTPASASFLQVRYKLPKNTPLKYGDKVKLLYEKI